MFWNKGPNVIHSCLYSDGVCVEHFGRFDLLAFVSPNTFATQVRIHVHAECTYIQHVRAYGCTNYMHMHPSMTPDHQ